MLYARHILDTGYTVVHVTMTAFQGKTADNKQIYNVSGDNNTGDNIGGEIKQD